MNAVHAELERIRHLHPEELLIPEEVVRAAQSPRSPLHELFTWDDTEAARRHRLEEARQLIRVTVTLIPGTDQEVRAYVSLSEDRPQGVKGQITGGGGYRATAEVMSDEQLRAILLADAQREMRAFQNKYARLSELALVFDAMTVAANAAVTKKQKQRSKR